MKKETIVILGIQTTIAQSILGQLAAHDISPDQIELYDHHHKHIPFVWYQNEMKKVAPVDLFTTHTPYIALICDKDIPKHYPAKQIPKNSWVIDCTGMISSATCIIPNVNANHINPRAKHILCAPTSLSVILSQALIELKKWQPQIHATAILGTSFLGNEAAQQLKEQTRQVYTEEPTHNTNLPPLAFNLIPQIIPIEKTTTPHQIQCITGMNINFSHCFAPIFRGFCIYINCQFPHIINEHKIHQLWRKNDALIRLENPAHDFILSSAATLSETHAFISHIQSTSKSLSFWITGDDIQCGMSLNVLRLIQYLSQK